MKTIINSVTVSLPDSLKFYTALGFEYKKTDGGAYVYDSSIIIHVSANTSHRLGLSLLQESREAELQKLSPYTKPARLRDGYLISDTSGGHIKLLQSFDLLPQSSSDAMLGSFAGISIEVIEIDRSKLIWGALGYQQTAGDIEQGWMVLSKEANLSISLIKAGACPHIFTNPGLNYFNGEKIRR